MDLVWHHLDTGTGRFIPYPTSPPLFWKKRRPFEVPLDGQAVTVRGHVCGPFGIYNALPSGRLPPEGKRAAGYLLIHRPSGCPLVYQGRVWDCQMAADELVALDVRWDRADPLNGLLGVPAVNEILRKYGSRS